MTLHLIPETGLSTLEDDVSRGHRGAGYVAEDVTVRGARLDTLLQENGFDTGDVHFLMVDVEGAEADVLSSIDLKAWRPWVLVIEATAPRSTHSTHEGWEPAILAAGYQFSLFDGVSRFYVADERAEQLKAALSYPACALDGYVDHATDSLRRHVTAQESLIEGIRRQSDESVDRLSAETLRWRRAALVAWATTAAQSVGIGTSSAEVNHLRVLLDDARNDAAAVRQTVSWRVTRPLRAVRRLRAGR